MSSFHHDLREIAKIESHSLRHNPLKKRLTNIGTWRLGRFRVAQSRKEEYTHAYCLQTQFT